MPKGFEEVMDEKQRWIWKALSDTTQSVRAVFESGQKERIQDFYHSQSMSIYKKLLNPEDVVNYIQIINTANEMLDFFLIEYLMYAIITDEVNKNMAFMHECLQKYIRNKNLNTTIENLEKVFLLSLNIVQRANLQKILDIFCRIVYTMNLPKEYDYSVLSNMFDQSLIYSKKYTHVHQDSLRGGYIAIRKIEVDLEDGFYMTDPILVTYGIGL